MQGNLSLSSFVLIIFSVTLGSFGQICLKTGIGSGKIPIDSSPLQTVVNIVSVMVRPYALLGLALYVISTFSWFLVLSRVRLSIAYPMISMSYILVVILSSLLLHERIDWRWAIAGLACISVGVSCIGFGLGQMAGK